MVALTSTGHSTYRVTHPITYLYLPSKTEYLVKYNQFQGGVFVVYRTEEVYNAVIKWAILCSLEKDCIAPIDKKDGCDFFSSRNVFSGCVRFDQSVLNILLLNWHTFAYSHLVFNSRVIIVERKVTNMYMIKHC